MERSSADLTELLVEGERASLLHAAANARNAAMLTGTHGVVAPPLDRPNVELPAPRDVAGDGVAFEERNDEARPLAIVRARAEALASNDDADAVTRMRALLDYAWTALREGRDDDARAAAERVLPIAAQAPAAHALLRMLSAGRTKAAEQLVHVEAIAAQVGDAVVHADFLVEKARLFEARGAEPPEREAGAKSEAGADAIAAYREALELVPDHAGALAGLEAALDAAGLFRDLALHLGRLAGLANAPATAAWFHVERALLLDRRLGDVAAARAALERALELCPEIGPVRQVCVDHAVAHRDDPWLAQLLATEALLEANPARATILELDGALALLRAGGEAEAIKLLERAHGRAPTSSVVDARVASELARLLSAAERPKDALRVLESALRYANESGAEVVALRAIATMAERAGDLDRAVLALERARVSGGEDPTVLEDLDRLLESSGRHDARAVLWVREAALVDEPNAKARALLLAAQASTAAKREADAAKHREAAWIAAPGAPGVFDALAERIAPHATRDSIAARVALLEQAYGRATDPGRRLYYREKIAWLLDDVAGDPASAVRHYEEVLAIDPARRSAIAGLASAATRAGDAKGLARALLAEADVVDDAKAAAEARLRAAEALAPVDDERALALATDLANKGPVATRARALVTHIHRTKGRWEAVVKSLDERARAEKDKSAKVALALAEADVLANRLGAPHRALRTLEAAREMAPGDPSIASALIATIEASKDTDRLAEELARLAEDSKEPSVRVRHLVRAAELAESRDDGADDAVALYVRARDAMPEEPIVLERLLRIGARTAKAPEGAAPPLVAALRALDAEHTPPAKTLEELLATGRGDLASLRTAERMARRSNAAPQLANALALQVEITKGLPAVRALSALAALVAWTLPESDDLEPWDRLVGGGSNDAVVLDDLVRRARGRVRGGDKLAIELSLLAVERRLEGAVDGTERLLLGIDVARLRHAAGKHRECVQACRDALAIEPSNVGAATVLASVASEIGDRRAAVAAATALAIATRAPKARAALLRDAADLSAAQGDVKTAATLLEDALVADPDSVMIAARLAQIQANEGAWADLARALRRGLEGATTADAIVPMAAELATVAKERLKDPMLAIEALVRSRSIKPGHVPTLFLLAELYIGQRAWGEALDVLGDVVRLSDERDEKLVALSGRASILARVLDRAADAEVELRSALELDPHDARALRALLALSSSIALEERVALLSRLVVAETNREARIASLLELGRARRDLGDMDGAEGALVEAAAAAPTHDMLDRLQHLAGADATACARILGRAVSRARELAQQPGAEWLARLGDVELSLGRADEAAQHLEEALQLEPHREGARLSLARALSKKGQHEAASGVLGPLLELGGPAAVDPMVVRLLDEVLTGAGRVQQAAIARELRAVAGDLDDAGRAALDARRPMLSSNSEGLSGRALRSFVMPVVGNHAVWEAASVATSMAGKLARIGLTEQGATSRDRVKPKAVHPIRPIFDRACRLFDLVDIELAVSELANAPTIACEDAIWVVVPAALADWPEPRALAALTRPLARIALGVPWLGAIPNEEVAAILVAVARQVSPSFTILPRERVEPLVADLELRVRRAVDRKKKKVLEDLSDTFDAAKPIAIDAIVEAAVRADARAAFLLTGDLRAALAAVAAADMGLTDALRHPGPQALAAVLSRPVARDLVAFALGGDATALRRSLGTLWS